ncbi:hypothetical protein Tco_0255091 [Tanacetum coccineum]
MTDGRTGRGGGRTGEPTGRVGGRTGDQDGQGGDRGNGANGGIDEVPNFFTVIAQQFQNLLPTIITQVGKSDDAEKMFGKYRRLVSKGHPILGSHSLDSCSMNVNRKVKSLCSFDTAGIIGTTVQLLDVEVYAAKQELSTANFILSTAYEYLVLFLLH